MSKKDKSGSPCSTLDGCIEDCLRQLTTSRYTGMYTYYAEADTTEEAQKIIATHRLKRFDFDERFSTAITFSRLDGAITTGRGERPINSDINIPYAWEWSEDQSLNWNNYDWACAMNNLSNDTESMVRLTLDKPAKTMIIASLERDYEDPDGGGHPDHELTKIYDPKPSVEVFQDACNDIETVKEWYSIGDIKTAKSLRSKIKCYNTSHGLDILLKMLAIDGLDVTLDQAVGIILHDVCKYKDRSDVIELLMSHYLGRSCDEIANHGINSAILILSAFPSIKCPDMLFVFRHAKKKPFKCDADKLTHFEKAFFIFDDVIKDINHFKHSAPKQAWTELNKFFNQPKLKMIDVIFELTKSLH